MKVKIADIKIGDRARTDLGDLDSLRESIKKRGLINPIVVDNEMELVAGYRRLTCHKDLGLKTIEVRIYDDLTPLEKKILELEENFHKELTWSEQAKLRAEIHILRQEAHGKAVKGHDSDGWSLQDSAEALGVSPATLSQDLSLINALDVFPDLSKITSRRQALKALDKMNETALLTELARRSAEKSGSSETPYTIVCADSLEYLIQNVESDTIDLVLFDPPWGIDIDVIGSARGLSGHKTSFKDDSQKTAFTLIESLIPEIYRVMKDNTHMYFFFGQNVLEDQELYYQHFYKMLQKYFYVRAIPLIWVKESGGYTDFEVRFMPRYEAFFFCSKGLRRLNTVSSDVFEYNRPSTIDRIHTQQKSTDLYQQLIRLSSLPNEIVLDPCAGSCVTAVAATLSGRRSICIDNNQENIYKALEWIQGVSKEIAEREEDEE